MDLAPVLGLDREVAAVAAARQPPPATPAPESCAWCSTRLQVASRRRYCGAACRGSAWRARQLLDALAAAGT